MTQNEFIQWMKGFTEGIHEYNITPKQWDLLKEKLKEVEDTISVSGILSDHSISRASNDQGFYLKSPNGTPVLSSGIKVVTTPGTSVTYTANGTPNWYSINKIENDSREK